MSGFEPEWLAARRPFDERALDQEAVAALRAWAAESGQRPLRLVDLGSGTGAALRRAARWLEGRPFEAFAVDRDPALLAARERTEQADEQAVTPVRGDLLRPLDPLGGPADGTVDLVLGHAVADLLPLDRLARRVAALPRRGGLAHLALTYDGETTFEPVEDPVLEARVLASYHRHMDLPLATAPAHGGSLAGRRLVQALREAGLEVVRAAPSIWDVRPVGPHGRAGRLVLERMIRFVVESSLEVGEPAEEIHRWRVSRQALLAAGRLSLRVRHLDVLARRPGTL